MKCNKLQGTDDWKTFMKKMGKKKMRSVTSGKKRKTHKRKTKKKAWVNILTGKRESTPPFFDLK